MIMNGRKLIITEALISGRETAPGHARGVFVEAKSIRNPGRLSDHIREARGNGDWMLACALALDDARIRVGEFLKARTGYRQAREEAIRAGDTGLLVELEVRWDAKLGEIGGRMGILEGSADTIADTLVDMYRKNAGTMSVRQWKRHVDEMMEMLTLKLVEKISQEEGKTTELVRLSVSDLDLIGALWAGSVERAEKRVEEEERLSSMNSPLAS